MILEKFEMPFFLKIDNGIIFNLKEILKENENPSRNVLLITDKTVDKLYGDIVYKQLNNIFREVKKRILNDNMLNSSFNLALFVINNDYNVIIGLGGGKVLDVSKYAAFISKKEFISIPTAIAHDGIASPIAVLKCDNSVKSLGCRVPSGIIIDLKVISHAPINLIKAGIGDTLSNLIAIKDWKLAHKRGKEKINDFALLLSETAINAVLNCKDKNIKNIGFLQQVAESLVLSGLAMNIAGSSRPCSGSEHLISHSMDRLDKGNLHGIQVAVSSIISSYLYNDDYKKIINFLNIFEIPTTLKELNISYDEYMDIMLNAKSTRPNRYTILDEIDMSKNNLEKIYKNLFK
jgi:glycerol-1-phosphate dehydrogenase [NAD(P)+]